MNQKKWIRYSVRVSGYFLLIIGLLVAGHTMENIPAWTFDLERVRSGAGMGELDMQCWQCPQGNITWGWDLPAYPFIVEPAKYDLGTFTINWSTFFLQAWVGGEKGFVNPTNVTSNLQYGSHNTTIPLHYNVSRGEYIALFDLEPYWYPSNYLKISLMVNTSSNGLQDVVILELPRYHYFGFPFTEIFLIVGIIGVAVAELLMNIMRKNRSLQVERRKDQALLRLLRQQNQGAYETALRQLQEDHNQLIRQIQSENHREGGRPDA